MNLFQKCWSSLYFFHKLQQYFTCQKQLENTKIFIRCKHFTLGQLYQYPLTELFIFKRDDFGYYDGIQLLIKESRNYSQLCFRWAFDEECCGVESCSVSEIHKLWDHFLNKDRYQFIKNYNCQIILKLDEMIFDNI